MRKTPSYLKGLAETRARVAADVPRLKRILSEVKKNLKAAEVELEACDRLIRKFDGRLNPKLIQPIKAWQGRYGKRGQFQIALLQVVREAFPEAITTTELSLLLRLQFQLDFDTSQELGRWHKNSLLRALKRLVDSGTIERLHDYANNGSSAEVGRWRWKSDVCLSLDHLQAQAAARGLSVQRCDDVLA